MATQPDRSTRPSSQEPRQGTMISQRSDRDDSGYGRARGSFTRAPRWVKVFVLVAVAIAVLGMVVMLLVGGGHGPGRHQSATTTSHRVGTTTADWEIG